MFNHQYDFDIEIPGKVKVSSVDKHDSINLNLLENKVVIGLCGYGKSGKDTIAERFMSHYGFHRIAFADILKGEMNEYLKEAVCNDINKRDEAEVEKLRSQGALVDYQPLQLKDVDFFTEDLDLKRQLRPYIIWYAEKLREINGHYYWINKTFEGDVAKHDKLIITDIRRSRELEIFKNSNNFKKRTEESWIRYGLSNSMGDLPKEAPKPYSSLLFHVNQLALADKDVLTQECIRIAQENWIFDHTFYVDPRIRQSDRGKVVKYMVDEVVDKFGINKPDRTISERQTKMF